MVFAVSARAARRGAAGTGRFVSAAEISLSTWLFRADPDADAAVSARRAAVAPVVYVQADSRPDNALELPYQDEEIPSGFYPVQVEIGIQDTYNVEIKSGVNDGDTVFTQMITDQAWG